MSIDADDFSCDSLRERVNEIHPLQSDVLKTVAHRKVIVACSGGADSIALAIILRAWDTEFALAYIDHGINPETSECEIIVKNLAQKFDVPFFTAHLDMGNAEDLANVEASARSLRYMALETLRTTHGYHLIATAHHLDDIAETFLINLMRGAGSGISSLSPERDNIVRPLLDWRKAELEELVTSTGIEYFVDPMNSDPRFVRNRVRNEVIPLLNDVAQRDVTPLIARTAGHIQRDNAYLQKMSSQLWPVGEPSTRTLMKLDPVERTHALRTWIQGSPPSNEELDRIMDVVEHRTKSTQISGHRTIWRTGAVLYQDVTPPL